MPIRKPQRAKRKMEKAENYRKRVPRQPAGEPMGEHLTGFKGSKIDLECNCGGCHPNARLGKHKVVHI